MESFKKNHLDENISMKLFGLISKTRDFQIYKYYNIASFSFINRKAQYKKGQRNKKDKKDKKDRENKNSEKTRKNHYRN